MLTSWIYIYLNTISQCRCYFNTKMRFHIAYTNILQRISYYSIPFQLKYLFHLLCWMTIRATGMLHSRFYIQITVCACLMVGINWLCIKTTLPSNFQELLESLLRHNNTVISEKAACFYCIVFWEYMQHSTKYTHTYIQFWLPCLKIKVYIQNIYRYFF